MSDSQTSGPRSDVTLTRLTETHAEAMFRWVSDPLIAENIGLRSEPTLQRTREWISRASADFTVQAYAILWKGDHVGNVVLDRADPVLLSSRLSIYIGEAPARRIGVGHSALMRAAEIHFIQRGQNKIWLTVHTGNHAAIASYKRAGFQIEGTLRDEFKLRGTLVAAHYMGLLRADFERLRQ